MTTWEHETIEMHNAEKGTVYVFRWVPDYAPFDGRRKVHPTFDALRRHRTPTDD